MNNFKVGDIVRLNLKNSNKHWNVGREHGKIFEIKKIYDFRYLAKIRWEDGKCLKPTKEYVYDNDYPYENWYIEDLINVDPYKICKKIK